MKYEKYLKIPDPHEALKAIALSEALGLNEIEEAVALYAEIHGITTEEMAYYPNGERVLQPPF